MDELASWIIASNPERVPVINKTGLQGMYKFKIAYSAGRAADHDLGDPDVITAVEQQLGLKLVASRGPVQHFVVDSIEKPDENRSFLTAGYLLSFTDSWICCNGAGCYK